MRDAIETIRRFNWQDLASDAVWMRWREVKIRVWQDCAALALVEMDSLAAPSAEAIEEIERRCSLTNYALYRVRHEPGTVEAASADLARFAGTFGLTGSERHRSAGHAQVVALRTSSEEAQKGYIPYTTRPLNWHTDGYYNAPEARVQGFVLHCHQQAASGGENQLMDPEIAYLRLREANPDYIRALMHPQAMTIPANQEPDGSIRPDSVGPVFYADPATGRLQMRYTARTRSIHWREDALTLEAADWLRDWLTAGDPLMRQLRLAPGEGIVNNNILHNRTRFEDGADEGGARIILRLRFHARVAERIHGAA